MNLTLNLQKPGEAAPAKLALNLAKNEKFSVLLAWKGQTDLDSHALMCINRGGGARVSSLEDILSTYNVKRMIGGQQVGTLERKSDNSFEIYGGALVHSPDLTDGDSADIDETITIDPEKLMKMVSVPAGAAIEIPIIGMIHPQNGAKKFKEVDEAWMAVLNSDGVEVMRASLSNQFGEFVGVQMGSLMIDGSGTHFVPVGVGFDCDFNQVLSYFAD